MCKCGTDLSLLQHIIARADLLFNQALDAYQTGQPAKALEFLEANAALIPFDTQARIVQAKLLAQLERWEEVKILVQRIQTSAPEHSEVENFVECVTEKTQTIS